MNGGLRVDKDFGRNETVLLHPLSGSGKAIFTCFRISCSHSAGHVCFPLAIERPEVTARKGALLQKKGLTEDQRIVYDTLAGEGRLSLQEVADRTGLSLGGVKKICAKLQEYGILERHGSKRDGIWVTK